MPKSLKEQLEESFDKAEEKEETGRPPEDTEEPLGDPPEGEDEGEDEGELGTSEDDAEGSGDVEGDPKDGEILADKDKPGDEDSPKDPPEEEGHRAPVSWKPAVREFWAKLPNEVKDEIVRRETEISRGLQQASSHKKMAEEYFNVIKPFEQHIRANNSTPAQAITNMMMTAQSLTLGNAQQKVKVVSEIISNYGIDIEMLDQSLSGMEIPDDANAALMTQIDTKLQPITDFMGRMTGAEDKDAASIQEEANADLQKFQDDSKNEFFEDVREEMADLMELNARRGRNLSLADAYTQACQNSPDIKKILDHRAAAARAARPSGDELARKRDASSSLAGGGPTGGDKGGADQSLRGSIESAVEEAEAR